MGLFHRVRHHVHGWIRLLQVVEEGIEMNKQFRTAAEDADAIKNSVSELLAINMESAVDLMHKDWDVWGACVGSEGSGKTTCAVEMCGIVDPKFSAEAVTYVPDEFQMRLNNAPKYSATLADEGVEIFFSQDVSKSANKDVTKQLMQIRYRNQFVVICIPDLFALTTQVRRRLAFCVRIIERGKFAFYTRAQIKQIKRNSDTKMVEYPRPAFYGYFKPLNCQLWNEIQEKKDKFVRKLNVNKRVLEEQAKMQKKLSKSMSFTEIAKIQGVGKATLSRWVYNYHAFNKHEVFKDMHGRLRMTVRGYKAGIKRLEKIKQHETRGRPKNSKNKKKKL